tara:strand:+ start:519 stop:908 length:390 start_codon:yes stop_codon:yes gene_type:complete
MNLKKILKIGGVLAVLAGIYVLYLLNKPHRDMVSEDASLEISADQLVTEYSQDEDKANASYIDKVIAVKGMVSESDAEHIKLKSGVSISGDFSSTKLEVGQEVRVKGRITGYDELFEEVSLDNGIVSSN